MQADCQKICPAESFGGTFSPSCARPCRGMRRAVERTGNLHKNQKSVNIFPRVVLYWKETRPGFSGTPEEERPMTTDQLSALLAQDPAAVLEHDRRLYEQQIVRAADLIAAHAQERPAVLLAGPSGSGKTTTALLIERELDPPRHGDAHALHGRLFLPAHGAGAGAFQPQRAGPRAPVARRRAVFPGAARQAAGGRGGGAAAL